VKYGQTARTTAPNKTFDLSAFYLHNTIIDYADKLPIKFEPNFKITPNISDLIRKLDPRQRKAFVLFQDFETITSSQIAELFGFKARSAANLCASWVADGFLTISDASNKGRKYRLSKQYEDLVGK